MGVLGTHHGWFHVLGAIFQHENCLISFRPTFGHLGIMAPSWLKSLTIQPGASIQGFHTPMIYHPINSSMACTERGRGMPNRFTLLALLLAFHQKHGKTWKMCSNGNDLLQIICESNFCKLTLKHFMPKFSEGLNFPSKTFNSISSRSTIRFLNWNFPNLSCHVYVPSSTFPHSTPRYAPTSSFYPPHVLVAHSPRPQRSGP